MKVVSNGTFAIAVSAVVTEMQVWCVSLAKLCGSTYELLSFVVALLQSESFFSSKLKFIV